MAIFDKYRQVEMCSETQRNSFITNIRVKRYVTYRSPHLIIQARFDVTMKTRILPIFSWVERPIANDHLT